MQINGKEALIAAAISATGITTMAATPYLVKPRFNKNYAVLFAAGIGLHTLGVYMFQSAFQPLIQREQPSPSSPPAEMCNTGKRMQLGQVGEQIRQPRIQREQPDPSSPPAEMCNTVKRVQLDDVGKQISQPCIQREQPGPFSPPAEMCNTVKRVQLDGVGEQINTIKRFDTFSEYALQDTEIQAAEDLLLELQRFRNTLIQSRQLADAKEQHKKLDKIPE